MTDRATEEMKNGDARKSPDSAPGDLMKEEQGRRSASPQQASPNHTMGRHPPPIMTNANRPPSTTSVHSTSSSNTPRTTTTSRRGGRTHCRSPPVSNRPGSASIEREFAAVGDSLASGPTASDDHRTKEPPSPANPSSAAAAAAAAAKALSNSSGNRKQHSWYESTPESGGYPERQRDELRHSSGYNSRYQGSRSWPGEEEPGSRRGYSRSQSSHRHGDEHYSQRISSSRYSDGYHHSRRGRGEMYRQFEEGSDYRDRRYGESRSSTYDSERMGRSSERIASPIHTGAYSESRHRHGHRRDSRDPYYKGPGGMAPADGRVSPVGRREGGPPMKRSGGTSRVIGTPTPIHVPRALDPPHPSRREPDPASVFRGRPGDRSGDSIPRGGIDGAEDDSPQKILLSLRTPTTSFEEKPSSKSRKSKSGDQSILPLSPEEPPQIQHSHHQHSSEQNLFFEPQRSPKNQVQNQASSSIEMAPSFSLFNQSFDSFGDTAQYFNVGGPLDSALQSTSFGAGPTTSVDNEASVGPLLNRNMSSGNYSQQLLEGTGSNGVLTFGMSPVNSFGNGPSSSSRRGGNMMLLGGHDQRSASPTQVLGMYPSYSGGGSLGTMRSRGPLEDSHMRLSGGSFGGQSLGHSYTRSFGDGSTSIHYRSHGAPSFSNSHEGPDGLPSFYTTLKKYRAAFKDCTFLLPGLKASLLEAPLPGTKSADDVAKDSEGDAANNGTDPAGTLGYRGAHPDPSPQDVAVARRRVVSAVCAFGGSMAGDRTHHSHQKTGSDNQSIFREKGDGNVSSPSVTVTPSSSTGTPPGTHLSRAKLKYDELLPTRYYENENRLSWEFEESPPVENGMEDDPEHQVKADEDEGAETPSRETSSKSRKTKVEDEPVSVSKTNEAPEGGKKASPSPSGEQPKMRYRCKLCGQPKQNHTCPYQQSLARSIGTMVYPAVNAFTSAEPGILAPALSDMNNFISSGSESISSAETSPSRPTPDRLRRSTQTGQVNSSQVTPETLRSSGHHPNSPSSSLSTGSGTPQRNRTPGSSARKRSSLGTPGRGKKRSHSQVGGASDDQGDLLFVEPMELKPEQFRLVTPSKVLTAQDAFTYPALPLPYAQRKRLSDNLFSMSKGVQQLTDECAMVLREAREKDLWDQAVSELMVQCIVCIHCPLGDARFEGLRQYLLTLGIAC